jgi:hypothetical protein
MKLYTEEQVRLLLDLAKLKINGEGYSKETLLEQVAPIELPSDEEVMYMSLPKKKGDSHSSDYMEGFNKGAKWVIEQIKQQDNA